MARTSGLASMARRLRRAERALERSDLSGAAAILDELADVRSRDFHALGRLVHAAAEAGRMDLAAAAWAAARELPVSPAARGILESEYLVARGELAPALAALSRPARAASNGATRNRRGAPGEANIVIPARRRILECLAAEGESAAGDGALPELDPYVLWFEPVISVLLFLLETRMEAAPDSPRRHEARTAIIRPDLSPELFRRPHPGILGRLPGRWRRAAVVERERRETGVVDRIHAGDLGGAANLLMEWIEAAPGAYGGRGATADDPRVTLLLEILFVEDRFAELVAFWESVAGDGARESAGELTPLIAYAELARGHRERGREMAAAVVAIDRVSAACAHLMAVSLLDAGPARVIPWLRRAFRAGDIDAVMVAQREIEFLRAK